MANRPRFCRPSTTDTENLEEVRLKLKEACEVLKQPVPDTFLGRKTREPFPEKEAD